MSVFAEKHYPDTVVGTSLDEYLARGWYRMGQSIFTTHFLCFSETLYSAVWIRLKMSGHRYRKGQRKLLQRNARRFRIEYGPLEITPAKEALYQKYKQHFHGYIARTLRDSLLDGEDTNTFHTVESRIYDGDRIVGLSFFDLGEESVASILGIYDPEYSNYSLGYYTMLLEMEYCREHEIAYFYPGYVVPGYERFDYKLRIGDVEYLSLATNQWEAYADLTEADFPLRQMEVRLRELRASLWNYGLTADLYYYPLFEANLFGMLQETYLDFPVILNIQTTVEAPRFRYLAVFDVRDQQLKLLRCSNFDDFRFYFNDAYTQAFDTDKFLIELTVVEQLLYQSDQQEDMTAVIRLNHHKLF